MNIAILTMSTLSLVASVSTLAIMAKTAHEMQKTKIHAEAEIADVKAKVATNARVIKAAIAALEV